MFNFQIQKLQEICILNIKTLHVLLLVIARSFEKKVKVKVKRLKNEWKVLSKEKLMLDIKRLSMLVLTLRQRIKFLWLAFQLIQADGLTDRWTNVN